MGACCTIPTTPTSSRSDSPECGPVLEENQSENAPLWPDAVVGSNVSGLPAAPIVQPTEAPKPDVKKESKKCEKKVEFANDSSGQHRSASTRAILQGKLSCIKRTKFPKVYICLLGLDDDSKSERTAIEEFLKNKVKKFFEERLIEMVVINVNLDVIYPNGFSAQEILENFLKGEVNRSTICRIVFVNEFLGRLAPPTSILLWDFEQTLTNADDYSKEYLLDKYEEDLLQSTPTMRLKPKHKTLLVKDCIDTYKKEIEKCSGEYFDIREVLSDCFLDPLKLKYFRSELERMAESSGDFVFSNRTFMVNRTITRRPSKSESSYGQFFNELEWENKRLDAVKDKLRIKVYNYDTKTISEQIFPIDTLWENLDNQELYLEPLCLKLYDYLEKYLYGKPVDYKILISNDLEDGVSGYLLQEIYCHAEHCHAQTTAPPALDIEDILTTIKDYLTNDSNQWLILTEASDYFLSYIMAHSIGMCEKWCPDACCFFRFVDLTTASSLPEGLFHYLFEQALLLLGDKDVKWKRSEYVKNFGSIMEKATANIPLVIFIDGITNELLGGWKEAFNCLPEKLPPYVKLVVSGSAEFLIEKKNIEINRIKNPEAPSNLETEPIKIFCTAGLTNLNWLLLNNGNDLLLRTKISRMFIEIEDQFYTPAVDEFFACLSLVNVGLSESEGLFIFERHYGDKSLATLDFFRLITTLRMILKYTIQNGIKLYNWKHEVFRIAAQNRYLIDSERETYINVIKEHLLGLDKDIMSNKTDRVLITRCAQEGNAFEIDKKKYELLLNPKWLLFTLEKCGPFQVLKDINAAIAKDSSNQELVMLREFFILSASSLEYEANQFFTQLNGRFGWKRREIEKGFPNIFTLVQAARKPFISTLHCTVNCIANSVWRAKVYNTGDTIIDGIFRIPENSSHVVSLSSTRGEVIVWKLITFEKVRIMEGINEPKNLKMIDHERCLLLCGRELRVYNLNDGTLLTKLRELMNQKSPFFALYDKDHPVTLSRSRMYVNMTNIITNKCDTTFKVGEDRFLNSLIVSGNGNICVCGDESKKPNSILVWNLETRKLLYDLKMPNHDFNTLIMAITYEGNYLCCVSDEIDDTGPNFVVVYDLQSGTIFKRWKPGPDTRSIGISSESSCIIVSLENSANVAWDLKSGTTRWASHCHTAPVDVLKIDDSGKYLLSWDSTGKDGSVRLWDMKTGEVLGTITPDQRITACELSNEGDRVFLGLDGECDIFSFELSPDRSPITEQAFGSTENLGKVFDLGQAPASI